MPEYDFKGTIDSNGNISGTLSEREGGGVGGLIFSIIVMVSIYISSLIGGIIVIFNVAKEAPFCIVPAILSYIILLIPIIIATISGKFFLNLLKTFFKWSNLLIGLIVIMFWISYISETLSSLTIMGMAFGLMYLTVITVIRTFKKSGVIWGIMSIVIPVVVYIIVAAMASDFQIGYLAIIPTASILISIFIEEIKTLFDFKHKHSKAIKTFSIIKLVVYIVIIVSIILFNGYTVNRKETLLQKGKDLISENKFSDARTILQDLKLNEAKELYDSIRYKDIKVGEVIYNGYYDSDARSISEDGIAFVCLDIIDDKALLISLDIIGLSEQGSGVLNEEYYTKTYSFNLENIENTMIGDQQSKFFLLSSEQYNLYIQNDDLSNYLKSANVSEIAKKQKSEVDRDTYQWTIAYTNFWLLNDFTSDLQIGTINSETGEFSYHYNLKLYAGIRLCYYATTK